MYLESSALFFYYFFFYYELVESLNHLKKESVKHLCKNKYVCIFNVMLLIVRLLYICSHLDFDNKLFLRRKHHTIHNRKYNNNPVHEG